MNTLLLPSPSPFPPLSHHHRRRRLKLTPPKCTTTSSPSPSPVIIIGAGLSGLAAATKLTSHNIPFLLLDSSDAVGGRVRTDKLSGFLLDRGFQIFITAYPEAQKLLNYDSLNLQPFFSGARVLYDGRFHTVSDPFRHLLSSLSSLTNPIGTLLDKLLVARTALSILSKSNDSINMDDELPTITLLQNYGMSSSIIDRFFRPFFGGIFFDTKLQTSSRLFSFVFKCLALGNNTLPANGISAIPEQLASNLTPGSLLLNSRVVSLEMGTDFVTTVTLQSGDVLNGDGGVIVAVEEPEAIKLLAGKMGREPNKKPVRKTVCLYFSADSGQIPVDDPVLFINGSGEGIVNNMFFATNVAPSYGPVGKGLVSVSLIGLFEDVSDDDLTAEVVRELSGWFGEAVVGSWTHLRTYRIGFAQPNQSPPTDLMKDPRVGPGLYVCGDYLTSATFDGALVSGRRAAEALLKDRALV